MYKNFITLTTVVGGLLSSSVALAVNPPNTIDLNQEFSASFTPSDYATAVQYSGAPRTIVSEVIPSTRQLVAEEVNNYEDMQLTPAQMQRLKEQELTKQRLQSTPYTHVANPVVRSISPDLSPGVAPPVIRVSKNILTSVVFTDLDGNPWNIEKVMLNRNQFDDTAGAPEEDKRTNILTLEPNQAIEYGNVTVQLKGKTLPVIFLLTSGQPEVDVRLDVRMKGANPNAPQDFSPHAGLSASTDIDDAALAFLDGTIPAEAEMLLSNDSAVRAWSFGGATYVKTSLDVLYPAYHSRATSPDGVNIYRFDNGYMSSLSLMQRGGQPVSVTLSEMPYQYDR